MAFPTTLTTAVDNTTAIVAAHLNALEAKVGIDSSAVATSLDYLLKSTSSVNPGHKHSALWASDGSPQAVWVDAAGNVGIGTLAPDALLEVNGVVSNGIVASLMGSGALGAFLHFSDQTLGNWSIGYQPTTSNFAFIYGRSIYNAGASVLEVTLTGNVGIGTASPAGLFEVSSDDSFVMPMRVIYEIVGKTVDLGFVTGAGWTSGCYISGLTGRITQATPSALKGELEFHVNIGDAVTMALRLHDDLAAEFIGNVGLGITAFGTSAAKVLGIGTGTAPTTAPADMAQMWVEDINAAAGYAGLHKRTETTNQKEIVPGVIRKTDTGSPANPYEGLMEINTADNKVRMYADAGWRELGTWT